MLFDMQNDPAHVTIDCAHLHDSAIAALEAVQGRYERAGKRVVFAHLSPRCSGLLARAEVEVRVSA
ncbi:MULTISPECIES: hypothetical protein [Paraburkholderia]|uniref:Uncharacterized protein n=1 Tax=Paraburkholderia unamae TaxID=219649 RepID=A0ACC6RN71_9BURK